MKKHTAAAQTSHANGTSSVGTGRGAKTRAVQEAMNKGISSPTKIVEYLRDTHNLEITAAHVSAIKTGFKTAKGKGKSKKAPVTASAPAAEPVKQAKHSRGLTPHDLGDLANLAHRAGGVDSLQEYLEVLKKIR
jgi:hypothetical protein